MISRALSLAAALSLLVVSMASAMTAATEHIGSVPVLLGLEKVRTELKLNSLQKAVLDSLRDEYKSAARKIADPLPTTKDQRIAAESKLQALNARYNNRALTVLNDSQRKRFLQIEHQVLGATTLYSPKVQKTLALTPEQVAKVEKLRQKGLASVGKINHQFEDGKIGYQERLSQLRSRRLSQGAALLKLLTPAQLTAYQALGGQKVTL